MPISKTPHDTFFYQVMSRKEKAITFFARYLPKKVLDSINLETISLAEGKNVSDAGVYLYNDVLYRCEFDAGQPGYLFAMCEHQSTPDDQMPLRLLEYNAATIRKHHKQDKGGFPVIVNIVLYHGKRPWNYSTAFTDYYANPALGKEYLYMAPFTLVNIPQLPTQEIYQDHELGFCFTAFRCTSEPDPYQAFKSTMHEAIFKANFDTLSVKLRNLVLAYIGKCIDRTKYSLADLANLASNNEQEKEKIMTSIAHEFLQEGEQRGAHNKALHIARNMLAEGFAASLVKRLSGISEEELRQLEKDYARNKQS